MDRPDLGHTEFFFAHDLYGMNDSLLLFLGLDSQSVGPATVQLALISGLIIIVSYLVRPG